MWSHFYRLYRYRIYPRLKHIRGATRFKRFLDRRTTRDIPTVDPEVVASIAEREWDHLFILDACRYDLWAELKNGGEKRVSVGSTTKEFISRTFSTGDWHDTVVVTANPHYADDIFEDLTGRRSDEVFAAVYHAYLTDWDETENTVLAESLVNRAQEAARHHPEKRLIVHFMQPHYPFVTGETRNTGIRPDLDHESEGRSVWDLAELGEYDAEKLWQEYRDNLSYVLEHVEELAHDLGGRVAITSDHGNLVGESGRFGHFAGSMAKPLREVPWDIIDAGDRKIRGETAGLDL